MNSDAGRWLDLEIAIADIDEIEKRSGPLVGHWGTDVGVLPIEVSTRELGISAATLKAAGIGRSN